MNSNSGGLINLAIVWGVASATGFAAMAALMVIGDWSVMQALFAAAVIFFGLGAVLSLLFLKPLPGPVKPGTAGWARRSAPAAGAAPAKSTTSEPAPAAAAAPPAASSQEPAGEVAPTPAPAPEPAPAPVSNDGAGIRPAVLDAPRDGGADDLKRIKGIGPKLEKLCNSMGFYHFDQIAAWTEDEVAWVDANLEGFKGRVTRDSWVDQARQLASGGETEFSRKVDKGGIY